MIKLFFTILYLGFSTYLYSQGTVIDTILTVNENLYIKDHKKQFNVKFEVSNDILQYSLPKEGVELNIKPNLNLKYAFVLSYKFASIRLGIRPRVSDEDKKNKGDSNSFRLHFKLLFDYWSHLFEYNHDRGYYVVNTKDFIPEIPKSEFRIQFPNLTTDIFSGSTTYKFNENYSVRAIESQTEIQIKSAGTIMSGINYNLYSIKGNDKIKFSEDEIIIRENYNDTQGFNVALNAGYYYTFVYQKHWYANAYLSPGMGIDFYETTSYTPDETLNRSFNDVFYSLHSGLGIGYNGKKIFFGANYANKISSEKFNENKIQLQILKNSFHIFLGYRFKAPKSVKGTIDYIEKKVPLLEEKNR